MRTGGGVISLALLASGAAALAAPKPRAADLELSRAGVLEASKPLTIGVRGERGNVTVAARLLPDDALARLFRDVANRRRRVPRLAAPGSIGVPAQATVVRLDQAFGDTFEAAVDLQPLLAGKRGTVLVEARAGTRSARALFQVTDLGLLVVRSPIRSIVQVLRLSTGAPVEGATIMALEPDGRFVARGTTDAAGMLVMTATPRDESLPPDPVLLARTADGTDQVVLRRPDRGKSPDADENDGLELPPQTLDLLRGESIEADLITDRNAFQPGETVHVVGWIAAESAVHPDGLRLLPPGSELRLVLAHAKQTLATTSVVVTPEGTLAGALAIPSGAPTGNADVKLELPLGRGRSRTLDSSTIRVEAIRPARHGIVVRSDRRVLARGERAQVTITPAGGPRPPGPVTYEVTCEPIWRFRPAGLPAGWETGDPAQKPTRITGAFVAKAERPGPVSFAVSTESAPAAATSWCRVDVTASGARAPAPLVLLVHPRPYHVALKVEQPFPHAGFAQVAIRAVSVTGAPAAPRGVTLELNTDRSGALVPGSRRGIDLSSGRATVDIELPRARPETREYYELVARDAGGQLLAKEDVAAWPPNPPTLSARPGDVVPFVIAGREQRWAGGLVAIVGGSVQRAQPLPGGERRGTVMLNAGQAFYPRVALDVAAMYLRREDPPLLEWTRGEVAVPESTRALEIFLGTIPDFNDLRPARAGQSLVLRAIVRRADGRIVPGARVSVAMVDEATLARTYYISIRSEIYFSRYRNDRAAHWDMFGDVVAPYVAGDGWPLSGDNLGFSSAGTGDGGFEPPPPPLEPRWSEPTAGFIPDLAADADGAVQTTLAAPARGGLYRVRVFASAPLPGGAPGLFGAADMWIDFH